MPNKKKVKNVRYWGGRVSNWNEKGLELELEFEKQTEEKLSWHGGELSRQI